MDEVSFALESNKLVIPLLLRRCNVLFRLRRVQQVDFTGDYDVGRSNLLRALQVQPTCDAELPLTVEASTHMRSTSNELQILTPVIDGGNSSKSGEPSSSTASLHGGSGSKRAAIRANEDAVVHRAVRNEHDEQESTTKELRQLQPSMQQTEAIPPHSKHDDNHAVASVRAYARRHPRVAGGILMWAVGLSLTVASYLISRSYFQANARFPQIENLAIFPGSIWFLIGLISRVRVLPVVLAGGFTLATFLVLAFTAGFEGIVVSMFFSPAAGFTGALIGTFVVDNR